MKERQLKEQRESFSGQAAFTLLETLVAVAIFMILLLAVMNVFPGVFKLNAQTRGDQSVTIAAKAYMEQVRIDFNTPDSPTTSPPTFTKFQNGTLPTKPATSTTAGYDCTPTSQQLDATGTPTTASPSIRRVTLTCTKQGVADQVFTLDFGQPGT